MTAKEAIRLTALKENKSEREVREAMKEAIEDAFRRGKRDGHPFWKAFQKPPTPEEFIDIIYRMNMS